MKSESSPSPIDVKAFAHSASHIAGQDLLSKYDRLMAETQGLGAERVLDWSARGELQIDQAGAAQVWLHVMVNVSLPLTCQRCMGPVDIAVTVNRSFRFVESEEAAEAQDAEAEEDVLALSPEFCLPALIEDEVLMAMPVVPSHERCPIEVKLAVADPGFEAASAEKRNPFAMLVKLKSHKSS